MQTYIALFRGINVGGTGMLPMAELVALLDELGAGKVRTYIQSGNAVFRYDEGKTAALVDSIRAGIEKSRGFRPDLQLWELAEIERAIAVNPFPEAASEPKSLHLGFLARRPEQPDLASLEELRQGEEQFRLIGRVFYLKAPAGVGKSRLAARAEKLLGVPMTDRNWRTVCMLRDMARAE